MRQHTKDKCVNSNFTNNTDLRPRPYSRLKITKNKYRGFFGDADFDIRILCKTFKIQNVVIYGSTISSDKRFDLPIKIHILQGLIGSH